MNSQIQIELWAECRCTRCKFCNLVLSSELRGDGSHTNPNKLLSPEEKLSYIEKAIGYLHTIDWDKYDILLLRGGEILNEYPPLILPKVKEFIGDISALVNEGKIKKVFLVTGLKYDYETSLLKQVLDVFKANGVTQLMVGTSWDTQYRFTEKSSAYWHTNVKLLKNMGIEVHVTSILTEDFINKFWAGDKELLALMHGNFDFIAPQGKPELLGLKDFFPKRANCLKFLYALKRSPELFPIWKRLLHQNYRRAESIYFVELGELQTRDLENYSKVFTGDNDKMSECGHPAEYCCYQDSDACFLCDINTLDSLAD